MPSPRVFHGDIEDLTKANTHYRKVLFTGANLQLVVMSLEPGESIPLEVHDEHDQFIRVDAGRGCVVADGKEYALKDGVAVVIPAGVHHEVRNTSKKTTLKLYTLYSPPEHRPGLVHRRMPVDRDKHH